jgi:hypothetical protein
MQAYYNVLTNLKAKLEADKFVNTVTQGDIFDIDLEKQTIFPLSHIMVNDVTKIKNILVFNVTVMCMDIVDLSKDETTDIFLGNDNEQDVLNTQLAVGLRLVELLERGSNNSQFMMRGEPSFEGFTERFENNIAGWAVTFDIHVPNTMTSCDDVATGVICSPVNVENSDGSYIQSVSSGSTLSLPDINIDVNSTNEGSIPSVKDVDILLTNNSGTVTPVSIGISGGDVSIVVPDASPVPVGLESLKTNQTSSSADYDDAYFGYGRDADFFTLENPNPFGNNNAFTDELGGQTYANDIVINWHEYNNITGKVLGIHRVVNSGHWDTARTNCFNLSVDTFTSGWMLPNIRVLTNLMIYEGATGNQPLNWAPLNMAAATFFWSGTYNTQTPLNAQVLVNNNTCATSTSSKSLTFPRYFACRVFTVTGTILT